MLKRQDIDLGIAVLCIDIYPLAKGPIGSDGVIPNASCCRGRVKADGRKAW